MTKEERKRYVLAQLNSLPNAFQYIEVTNYIDLLEQENQQLKEQIKQYENPEDLTLMFMYCDERSKDKIRQLENQLKQRDGFIDELEEFIYNKSRMQAPDYKHREFEGRNDLNELLGIFKKYKETTNEQRR